MCWPYTFRAASEFCWKIIRPRFTLSRGGLCGSCRSAQKTLRLDLASKRRVIRGGGSACWTDPWVPLADWGGVKSTQWRGHVLEEASPSFAL
jgi:hypothetical protein